MAKQKRTRQHNGQTKKDRQHNGQTKKDRQHNGQTKKDKGQTTIYKTLHRNQKIEQHEHH
jgi:replication fork clamp-binding protein CrfC